ncbi:SCO family protein [Deinococcus sonorensis]|uniref:SCO family protein n=2 Tax=Deinococcus sonorensis TaxID=309891 RepID=A0AAU7U856_9DEIO
MKWLTAVLLALAAVMGGVLAWRTYGPHELHGTALERPRVISSVPLTRDDGQPQDLHNSQGRLRLVFFGYTRCPDVCPATLGMLARTYEALSPAQQARLLVQLVTVDPAFDTPAVLRRYLASFNPDFQGLTGSAGHIRAAEQALYVYAAPGDTPISMVHGDGVALVDRAGQFIRVYNNEAVARGDLGADLPTLLRE